MTTLILIGGLLVLTLGAELLVRGASALATAARITPLVIGLTVVAPGTSAPELVVSTQASLRGQADIALGNVVGSNIFNVLFILGVSAMIIPLRVAQKLVRVDVPLMIGLSALVAVLGWDGRIGRWDGAAMVVGLVVYTAWGVVQGRREQDAIDAGGDEAIGADPPRSTVRLALHVAMVLGGLALLVVGSRWFTGSATSIARELGISDLVIGLTIVAAGTSMPEVATSIMAAVRGERDIAVGNVVGSNIFNILGVLGLSGVVSAQGVAVSDVAMSLDIPVMIAVAVACLPIFFTGHVISRWEGGLFFAYSGAYTAYLILASTQPAISRTLGVTIVGFVVPLTVVTLVVMVVRAPWSRGR